MIERRGTAASSQETDVMVIGYLARKTGTVSLGLAMCVVGGGGLALSIGMDGPSGRFANPPKAVVAKDKGVRIGIRAAAGIRSGCASAVRRPTSESGS